MLGYINGCSWPVHRLIQKEYMSKYELILDPKRCFTSMSEQKKNTIQFIAV